MTPKLSLAQKFYLLQLRKNHKSLYIVPSTSEGYILGTIIMELRIKNIIDVANDSKINIIKPEPTGIDYLDDILNFISQNTNKTIIDLYYTFLSSGKYTEATAKMVKSFTTNTGEQINIDEDLIKQPIENLRAEILEPGEVSTENKALILMLNSSNYDKNLAKYYFSEYEQTILRQKMTEIQNEDGDLVEDLLRIRQYYQGSPRRFFAEIFVALNPKNFSNGNRSFDYVPRNLNWFDGFFAILFAVWSVRDFFGGNYSVIVINLSILSLILLETNQFYKYTKLKFNSNLMTAVRGIIYGVILVIISGGVYNFLNSGINLWQ
jgi:hypothetical protein